MVRHHFADIANRAGVKYEEKIWDHAAGQIVIEEAGGKVTDIRGKPLDFSIGRLLSANTGVIATNGIIHDEVIAVSATQLSSPQFADDYLQAVAKAIPE